MPLVEINRNPGRRDLLVFGAGLPLLFGLLGALRWHRGAFRAALVLWVIGGALSLIFALVPKARRALYLGWMYLVYPIGWIVSHVTIALLYFAVATPIALLLRLFGHDPMRRRPAKDANSYWIRREPVRDKMRYFRQF